MMSDFDGALRERGTGKYLLGNSLVRWVFEEVTPWKDSRR